MPLAREAAWSVVKFVLVLVKGRPLARETAWSRSVSNSQICFGTGQRSAFSTLDSLVEVGLSCHRRCAMSVLILAISPNFEERSEMSTLLFAHALEP